MDTEKICRICVKESSDTKKILHSTADSNGKQTPISNILSIFDIKLEDESSDFPKSICANCLNQATAVYSFKLLCERSKSLIEIYLEKIKDDNVSDSDDSDDPVALLEVDFDSKSVHEDSHENDSNNTDPLEIDETVDKPLKKIKTTKQNRTTSKSDIIYKCSTCGKSFRNKSVFVGHQKRHELKGQFLCTVCGKGFNSQSCLTRHARVHTGEKNHECNICKKKFVSLNNLKLHFRTHSGQKPYLCTICGKNFGYANGLMYHMRTHTKEKPFKCDVCGKCFSTSGNITRHMITHTGWQNLKPVKYENICNTSS